MAVKKTADVNFKENDNPFEDEPAEDTPQVEDIPPVKPTSVAHLIALIGGEVGFMVRSAKAHYGKFVPLPDMLFMLQPVAQKYGAFISIREGYDPNTSGTGHTEKSESTRTSGPDVVKLNKIEGNKPTTVMDHAAVKTYEKIETSSNNFSGAMTTLTLCIFWDGEEYDVAVKAFPTSTNAQEDGKMVTYHSRYLLMTRFAIAIVNEDPDDPKPAQATAAPKRQATAAPKASSWKRG